ncbi:MAG: pyroglutamyl-peptidase I [Hyphomicrobium sp.]|nr:pyroglutamyl-peptidase I [Hyphomicrobium sp.]
MIRAGKGCSVLLTGFGPFPGVTINASANLASALAQSAQRRHPDHRFHVEVLPVAWGMALDRLDAAFAATRPHVSLHFGVSDRAEGLVIETVARNACADIPDADGKRPRGKALVAGGRNERKTRLPVRAILERLERAPCPAILSDDAGTYLCNAVMYHALASARRATPPRRAGFIHIPTLLGRDMTLENPRWRDVVESASVLLDIAINRHTPSEIARHSGTV